MECLLFGILSTILPAPDGHPWEMRDDVPRILHRQRKGVFCGSLVLVVQFYIAET